MKLLTGIGLSALFLITACGGGGGGGKSGDDSPDVRMGQFIDSPVQGLRYETDTQNGITNADGEFEYIDGESIRFYFGSWLVGEAIATPELTPFSLNGVNGIDDIAQFERWWISNVQGSYHTDVRDETRAMNLAFLLQNLDLDSDPENGITLPDNLSDLTDGYVLDLERLGHSFLVQRAVRGVITRARSSGLWPNGLRVRTFPEVADHLVKNLYPNAQASVRIREEFSNSTSGIGTPNSVTNRFYDGDGRLSRLERDTDADGSPNTRTTYTRNDLGLAIITEVDSDVDGSIDNLYTSTYTSYGVQTRDLRDNGNDGVEYDWRAEYNDFGRYTIIERYDNGTLAVRNEYSYLSDGTFDFILRDTDGDGSLDERITYEHTDGLSTSVSYDTGNDGTVDRVVSYQRNAMGDITVYEDDTDANGAPNLIIRYSYNAAGHRTRFEQDSDADGAPNYVQTTTYNDLGQQLVTETDSDGDGVFERMNRSEYNAEGFRTLYESDHDDDPAIETRITYTLDANGNAIRFETDTNDDFVADSINIRTYNEYGQNLINDTDSNADGVIDNRTEYTYELVVANDWHNRLGFFRFGF